MHATHLRFAIAYSLAFIITLSWAPEGYAQDSGQFEGAVWSIELKPKSPSEQGKGLRGRYRVNDHVLYQCKDVSDRNFTIAVGKNFPNGTKTRAEFESLRMFSSPRDIVMLKGKVGLKMERYGEWSGVFIDSDGKHWDCRVKRIQE